MRNRDSKPKISLFNQHEHYIKSKEYIYTYNYMMIHLGTKRNIEQKWVKLIAHSWAGTPSKP